MNYLAHFHLSADSQDLLAGALLGDFVKGPIEQAKTSHLSIREKGILLHRSIDAFTDSHPLQKQSYQLLPSSMRRYAGVILDVFYDHLLSQNWQHFHPQQSLNQFADEVYCALSQTSLPAEAKRYSDNFKKHSVLTCYQHWENIPPILERIGQRFKRDNPLHLAAPYLMEQRAALENLFMDFYPQLMEHSAEKKQLLAIRP